MEYTIEKLTASLDADVATALLESINRSEQQTFFAPFPKGFSLWFRYLKIEHDDLEYGHHKYLYLENKLYKFNFEKGLFEDFEDGVLGLVAVLENYLSSNEYIIKEYINEVEKLEDLLYERSVPTVFMDIWFDVKKDLSRIERFLGRHSRALNNLLSWNEKNANVVELELIDLQKNNQYQISNVQGGLSRLDHIHHYYSSIKNDKLNKNIYLLTLVSGIFLPLNLIVGFFGMNTKGLFFEHSDKGTEMVVYILGSILVFSILGQTLIKLVDRFVVRALLGRTMLYKNISSGLTKIEKSLGIDI